MNLSSEIQKAKSILSDIGCKEIYIFGSAASGDFNEHSDIDFAVKGCPEDKFFYALGKLLTELDHPVDLIDLDNDNSFNSLLKQNGELQLV